MSNLVDDLEKETRSLSHTRISDLREKISRLEEASTHLENEVVLL